MELDSWSNFLRYWLEVRKQLSSDDAVASIAELIKVDENCHENAA